MRISLDEKQLETLEVILNKLINTFEELAISIQKLTEEIRDAKKQKNQIRSV